LAKFNKKKNSNISSQDSTNPNIQVETTHKEIKVKGFNSLPDGTKKKIKIGLMLVLAYLVYDTMMVEPEPEVLDIPVVETPKKKKRKKDMPPVETPAPVEVAKEEGELTGDPSKDNLGTTTEPIEAIDTSAEAAPSEAAPKEDALADLDKPSEEIPEAKPEEEAKPEADVITEDVSTTPIETEVDPPVENNGGVGESSVDVVESDDKPKEEKDLNEEILKDLETQVSAKKKEEASAVTSYVSPPDYEYDGKGLAYNCKGKHWVCLDGPSYGQCEKNHQYLSDKNQSKECVPINVYDSTKTCHQLQLKKIVSNEKTLFCN
jgi:hypothetical protein